MIPMMQTLTESLLSWVQKKVETNVVDNFTGTIKVPHRCSPNSMEFDMEQKIGLLNTGKWMTSTPMEGLIHMMNKMNTNNQHFCNGDKDLYVLDYTWFVCTRKKMTNTNFIDHLEVFMKGEHKKGNKKKQVVHFVDEGNVGKRKRKAVGKRKRKAMTISTTS